MNKSELRQSYVDAGWTVQDVAGWRKVITVGTTVQYDVNVFTPDGDARTVPVLVTDDTGPSESATPKGALVVVTPEVTFDAAVRAHVAGVEAAVATIFAIAVNNVFAADEVAIATAYKTDGTSSQYVVKRRDGTFSQLEQI